MLKRYVGDRAFYRRVLTIALPIIMQNAITNFVSLLDNIMVGQVGTLEMSAVSIVNSLIFVFNLCIFGGASGAGIYVSQYFGSGDQERIRYTFRYKLLLCLSFSLAGIGAFLLGGDALINLYLTGEGAAQDIASTLQFGKDYLLVMLWGLVPFALTNAYSGTLRECGKAVVPMIGGIVAVFVNLCLNYVLIFGHFGAPAMGVRGAALATVISRYVELAVVVAWAHCNTKALPFMKGLFRSIKIPGKMIWRITLSSLPMLLNEAFWSAGEAMHNQIFSTRGLDVVPAVNISSTVLNLCNVAVLSMGGTIGIIMGQMQGSGKSKEELWDAFRKICTLTIAASVLCGGLLAAVSGLFPQLYNTTADVRQLAMEMILICAAQMPLVAYVHQTYFTMRSGGKTLITFIFDSGFSWLVMIPVTYTVCHYTNLSVVWVFAISRATYIVKCLMGYFIMRRGTWIRNLAEK